MLSSSEELSPIQSVISLVIGVALGLVFLLGVLLVDGWLEVSEAFEDEGVAAWPEADFTGTKTCPEANLTGTAERARPDRLDPRPRRPETERPRGFMIREVFVVVVVVWCEKS